MSQYIIQGIFAAAGIVSLLAAVLNWDWFFTANNTQFVVQRVGRPIARWIYGTLGTMLMGMALYLYFNVP